MAEPRTVLQRALENRNLGLEQQQQQINLVTAPDVADTLDYDRAAQILKVQSETLLPAEVVAADLDNLSDQVKRKQFNYKNYTDLVNGAPIFNKWVSENPYHPVVAERDRRNLSLMERTFDSLYRGIQKGDAQVELARISNRRAEGDEREGDEEILNDLREIVEAGNMGLDGWASVLVETGVQGKIQAYILGESWELAAAGAAEGALVGAGIGAWTGAGAGVTALTGAGYGLATGWRLGAFEASRKLEKGLAYDQYLQMGADEQSARRIANMVGVANGALELIGINALVKNLPGARRLQGQVGKTLVEKMFARPTIRGAAGRLFARYGETMGTEIVTEILQESITMAGAEFLKGEMRAAGDLRPETAAMTFDDWAKSVGDIALQTMKGTAIIGGIGPGLSYISDVRKAQRAKANGIFIRALGETAENSTLRQDVPAKYREYLQAQQERGPIKELRFDLDAWREHWESQDMDVEEVNKSLGLKSMEVLEAEGAQDVVLSLETFGDKLAHTKHFQALWQDVRLRPDDMTYREAKTFLDNPEEHLNRLKEDLDETFGVGVSDDVDRIIKDIAGQLVAPGIDMERSAAEQQARLMATVFTTQALRNPQAKVTPWDLYVQRFGGVRRDVRDVETLPPGAVDLALDPMLDRIRANNFPTQREMRGDSLIGFIVANGGMKDDGGELSAMDWSNKMRPGLINASGDTLDGMAERAHEAGFIAARDPQVLKDAMARELDEGEAVFSSVFEKSEMVQLNEDLMALAEYLESEGVDVESMTNQEIRDTLSKRRTFDQEDKQSLTELTELIVATIGSEIAGPEYGQEMHKLMRALPMTQDDQDFGDLEFTDRVRQKGRPGTRKRKAQKVFDMEVKRRNSLKRLLDCLGARR